MWGKTRSACPGEAMHGLEQLLALLVRFGLVPGSQGSCHAVLDVVVQYAEGEAVERGRNGAQLREDVDAVAVFLEHPLDAAHLAFDPVQALDEGVLVLGIAMGHVVSSRMLRNRRSRSEFPTTNRLEPAMAAAATIGLSRPATASGIAAML